MEEESEMGLLEEETSEQSSCTSENEHPEAADDLSIRIRKGDRYELIEKETNEKRYVKILGRAGKATSKRWSDSYNIQDIETGEQGWVDMRNFSKWRKMEEKETVYLCDFHDEDIIRAKLKELHSWREKNEYEAVPRTNQKLVSTRWIVTEKEKEGKRICKARLVARGFEEKEEDMKTDSPTCASETLKAFLSLILKHGWKTKTLDVKTAYLQGKEISRTVYLQPPEEAKTDKVWKLRKTVYGLKDAARAWYDSVLNIIEQLGGEKSRFDPTIFIWKNESGLMGLMCAPVDDFIYGGNEEFQRSVIQKLRKSLEVGPEEDSMFRYLGLNIHSSNECTYIDQEQYIKRMTTPVRKEYRGERPLNPQEQTLYRVVTVFVPKTLSFVDAAETGIYLRAILQEIEGRNIEMHIIATK